MKIYKTNKSFTLEADNGKKIGSLQLDIDGYYYLWFDEELAGCWTAHNLREIAATLDEVNKPFDEQVKKDFAEKDEKRNVL